MVEGNDAEELCFAENVSLNLIGQGLRKKPKLVTKKTEEVIMKDPRATGKVKVLEGTRIAPQLYVKYG